MKSFIDVSVSLINFPNIILIIMYSDIQLDLIPASLKYVRVKDFHYYLVGLSHILCHF